MITEEKFNKFFDSKEIIAKEEFINGKRKTIMSVEEFEEIFND